MYYFEPVMIVCMVESEMGWLVIPEREKKLLLSCYKLNLFYIYIHVINTCIAKFFYILFIVYVSVNLYFFTAVDF